MSWSSSESEKEQESNHLIRHYEGSVICFNIRSYKRYAKICKTKNDLNDDNLSERFSGGAMLVRMHLNGRSFGKCDEPWMTIHQNSVLLVSTPILFKDIQLRSGDALRVIVFIKNYMKRAHNPIKRYCELKFRTKLEAQVFIETYNKVIQEMVSNPRSAEIGDDMGEEENETENFSAKDETCIDISSSAKNDYLDNIDFSKLVLDPPTEDQLYDDEDYDDLLVECTQDPFSRW